MDTPRGIPRNGAGKNDRASSLEANRTDALQRKRQESFSLSRLRGRGNSRKLEKLVEAGIQGAAGLNSEGVEGFPLGQEVS